MSDFFVIGKCFLDFVDSSFNYWAVVDVDVAEKGMFAFVVIGYVIFMPAFQIFHDLCAYLLLYSFGNKVTTFVYIDDVVEQFVYTRTVASDGGHHGDTHQLAQLFVVELVSAGLKFIVHVQGYYHSHIHIDELGSEVEVTF